MSARGSALYVYGIAAPGGAAAFEAVVGIDGATPVVLVEGDGCSAIASTVSLAQFGEGVLEANLRDPEWLEEKVRAHDRVLGAAVGRAAVVPFRFGTIYRNVDHVREMLRERRDLLPTLERLDGKLELGVKAFLSRSSVRDALAGDLGVDTTAPASGRAYMLRRSIERDLDDAVQRVAATRAEQAHERLAAAAEDARANPVRDEESGPDEQMFLNGAYLIRSGDEAAFRAAVASASAPDERFEVTGPWPPYNFVGSET